MHGKPPPSPSLSQQPSSFRLLSGKTSLLMNLNSLSCQGLNREPEPTPRVKNVTPRSGWMTAQRNMGEIHGYKTIPQNPPTTLWMGWFHFSSLCFLVFRMESFTGYCRLHVDGDTRTWVTKCPLTPCKVPQHQHSLQEMQRPPCCTFSSC